MLYWTLKLMQLNFPYKSLLNLVHLECWSVFSHSPNEKPVIRSFLCGVSYYLIFFNFLILFFIVSFFPILISECLFSFGTKTVNMLKWNKAVKLFYLRLSNIRLLICLNNSMDNHFIRLIMLFSVTIEMNDSLTIIIIV